jgi:hypothetical protein
MLINVFCVDDTTSIPYTNPPSPPRLAPPKKKSPYIILGEDLVVNESCENPKLEESKNRVNKM